MRDFNLRTILLGATFMVGGMMANVQAQHPTCGTDELHDQMLQNPRYRQVMDAQEIAYQNYVSQPIARTAVAVRKIPVVVHFIQNSDIQEVDDAAVYSQLEVLNEDFRRMVGTPGYGNGVDTQYEFCLATIDPDGCPTTGINRVVSPQWAFHQQADAVFMKGLIQWNPYKYLNIWVPKTIETASTNGQVIGYATFPFNISVSPNLDGIVIHSQFFGRDADTRYKGRTTTHEIGHWLGLFHTFQGACSGASANTCASQGDRVCDTPQASAANFGCPIINSCTDSPVDLPDQIENYMDYSDGTCQNLFTQGQKDRIDFYCNSIRTQLWSPANLAATGCDGTVSAGCTPIVDFKGDHLVVCVGTSVRFQDMSLHGPTSWNWAFQGGTPTSSTSATEIVTYNTPGNFDVTLSATNNLGSNALTKPGYITVLSPSTSLLQQGFEGILSLPQNWYVSDNQGINTWQLATNARSEGQNSMKVKNFDARNGGQSMYLYSNPFSLQNVVSGNLTFDRSYKKFSGLTLEGLKVQISTDCGTTWEEIYSKTGPYLATVAGNASTTEWVPTQPTHWVSDTVSLDSFAGQPNVKLRWQAIADGGQSIYLDNININATLVSAQEPAALGWDFVVAPNPFQNDLRITYSLQKPSTIDFFLTDLSGRMVANFSTGRQSAGRHELNGVTVALSNLPAGVYFLRGNAANGSITRKLVKMN